MKTSDKGINLIKEFEGFRSNPYLCPASVWTIGYGTTIGVTAKTPPVTVASADVLLRRDLANFEQAILKSVKVPLNQNQFDALVSFVYNIGIGAFRRSTLLRLLNASNYSLHAQFMRWVNAGGKKLSGLERRRQAESDLFHAPMKE